MKTYAYKTNASLYSNSAAEKRNTRADSSQRLHNYFQQERNSNRKSILRNGKKPCGAADSIIRLFRGTVVTDYTAGIEWGVQGCDIMSGN